MNALSSDLFFRPSMAPGVAQCASFMWRPEGLDIREEAGERADLGTACHELFYSHVYPRRIIDQFTLAQLADRHQVDVDGYEGVTWRARKMETQWAQLQDFYLDAHREEKIGYILPNGLPNEGTPDLWTIIGEEETRSACVLDLKTGLTDQDHREQLKDYCLIIYKVHGIEDFYASVFNPIQDYYETWHWTLADILEWEKELLRKMTVVAKEFRSGPACRYCPNLIRCPAHLSAVKAYYVPDNAGQRPLFVPQITPEVIRQVRPLMQHLAKVVESYKDIERGMLEQFGTIDLGEGQELALATRFKKVYDVPKSMPVFQKMGIGMERVLQSLKLTTEGVEDLAATVAPPRQKGKTIQLAKDLLKASDAFFEKAESYTQVRRKQLISSEADDG